MDAGWKVQDHVCVAASSKSTLQHHTRALMSLLAQCLIWTLSGVHTPQLPPLQQCMFYSSVLRLRSVQPGWTALPANVCERVGILLELKHVRVQSFAPQMPRVSSLQTHGLGTNEQSDVGSPPHVHHLGFPFWFRSASDASLNPYFWFRFLGSWFSDRSLFSLMLSCVVHRWKKKNILQSFYVNIPLKKGCVFFQNATGLALFFPLFLCLSFCLWTLLKWKAVFVCFFSSFLCCVLVQSSVVV